MKIEFWVIGRTQDKYLEEGTDMYRKRLSHYLPFSYRTIPDIKKAGKLSPDQLKEQEGLLILKNLKNDDGLILLDEKGQAFTSVQFARWVDKQLAAPFKRLIFLVGGAYGFSPALYQRADAKLALSKMTFSHQMVRLFFLEQLYRAMTILRNEPYHNQ